MKRLVVDASTLTSGVASRPGGGAPWLLLLALIDLEFEAILCPKLIQEFSDALGNRYFQERFDARDLDGIAAHPLSRAWGSGAAREDGEYRVSLDGPSGLSAEPRLPPWAGKAIEAVAEVSFAASRPASRNSRGLVFLVVPANPKDALRADVCAGRERYESDTSTSTAICRLAATTTCELGGRLPRRRRATSGRLSPG